MLERDDMWMEGLQSSYRTDQADYWEKKARRKEISGKGTSKEGRGKEKRKVMGHLSNVC